MDDKLMAMTLIILCQLLLLVFKNMDWTNTVVIVLLAVINHLI